MAVKAPRLGTRGSALALAQAELVADALGGAELVAISTSGDEGGPAHESGGDKSRFVREIERALLDGEVDLAVHSAKDLPGEIPDGLEICGVPERAAALDCWIGPGATLAAVPEGARVGTSSLRRGAQLLALRPDLELAEMRGNVDTRLRKRAEGECDAIVLAAAGLERLGRADEIGFRFETDQLTPAAGQGALAIEARADDEGHRQAAARIDDPEAHAELRAERAAVAALDASCDTPLGIHARHSGDRIEITAFCGLPDGSEWIRDVLEGDRDTPYELGRELAERLKGAGAEELLRRAELMAGEASR